RLPSRSAVLRRPESTAAGPTAGWWSSRRPPATNWRPVRAASFVSRREVCRLRTCSPPALCGSGSAKIWNPWRGCCDPRPYRRLASLEPDSATLAWATLPTTGSGGSEGGGWRRRGREASGKDKQSGAASIDIPPMQGAQRRAERGRATARCGDPPDLVTHARKAYAPLATPHHRKGLYPARYARPNPEDAAVP